METERVTVEPWRLCRACGTERWYMFPLSARDPDGGLRLDDMLMECTDLKIHVGDGLSSSICHGCADELKTSYRFKQRCETTDRYFNELGLKSNEIKQEQETVVFKVGENENLLELKEEKDTDDNSSSLCFKEVTEGSSDPAVISWEIKQEHGDLLTITETMVYKQKENFSEVTEDEPTRIGNLEDSPPNEDSRFEDFPNKKENRNIVSKKAENEFPSGSKEEKEVETTDDSSSEASSSSEAEDSAYSAREELRKTVRLRRFERKIRKKMHDRVGRKRFKCYVCGRSFTTSKYLRKHKETHANSERKYNQCNVCEKSYSSRRSLRRHKETHENGERKPYECETCENSYSSPTYLREHMRKHDNDERKRFECDVCEKSFATRAYMREHRLTHENGERKCYKCDNCEKSYATSGSLRRHTEVHKYGERKSFKCNVCGKLFATNRNLWNHKLTHEDKVLHKQK